MPPISPPFAMRPGASPGAPGERPSPPARRSTSSRRSLFKCEQYQKSGRSDSRGACNAVMKLSDAEAARGVATLSGNFAQAIALAARARAHRRAS
jgi:threonine dehydratase